MPFTNFNDPRAQDAIESALNDEDVLVRIHAEEALAGRERRWSSTNYLFPNP
jgi:hypothetical protein